VTVGVLAICHGLTFPSKGIWQLDEACPKEKTLIGKVPLLNSFNKLLAAKCQHKKILLIFRTLKTKY